MRNSKDEILDAVKDIQNKQQQLYAERVHQVVYMILVGVLALLFKNDLNMVSFVFVGLVFLTGMASFACELIRYCRMGRRANIIYEERNKNYIDDAMTEKKMKEASLWTFRVLRIQVVLLVLMLVELFVFYIITIIDKVQL